MADDDKKKGNTTLGFHESCHRQDFQDFLTANALPTFGGKVGQTVDEYKQAVEDYKKAISDYRDKANKDTVTKSDEVGNPTMTQYKAKKP